MNLKKNPLLTGTLLLTGAGLISRGIGFLYRSFLSHTFGEASMGLLQLLSPVLMLAFSLCGAGMQTAISRYTAICYSAKKGRAANAYFTCGCLFSLLLAGGYSYLIYSRADTIAVSLLKEARLAPLLRVLAFSFPLSALHSCLNGYFYGRKEARVPALGQLTEQFVRTGSVVFFCLLFTPSGETPNLTFTSLGMVLGEAAACLVSLVAYFASARSNDRSCREVPPSCFGILGDLGSMMLPLTASRLIMNLLHSVETVTIPQSLRAYGYSDHTALSIYGVLMGMAFSLVLFPSALTNSAAVLLMPMVSESTAEPKRGGVKKTVHRCLSASLYWGILCAIGFFLFADPLGLLLFNSPLAGTFIRQLSFLCPFLYLHSNLMGLLHGLKKNTISLIINVTSQCIRLFFCFFLIPRIGITGFFLGFLCSEIFSALCTLIVIRKNSCI